MRAPPSRRCLTKVSTPAKGTTSARARAAASPATMVARAKTPAKARVAATPCRRSKPSVVTQSVRPKGLAGCGDPWVPVERTRPACRFLRLAGNRSSRACLGRTMPPRRRRSQYFPWSARVSRAVSCVSRETVLKARTPRPSAHLLALASTALLHHVPDLPPPHMPVGGPTGLLGAASKSDVGTLPATFSHLEAPDPPPTC